MLAEADSIDPVLKKFGGGARDLEVRIIEDSPIGAFLVVHLIYDVRDAMGANAVNTACEKLAPKVEIHYRRESPSAHSFQSCRSPHCTRTMCHPIEGIDF